MSRHLVKWHRDYASQGLVIIEVDNGAQDSRAAVESHLQHAQLPFTMIYDEGGRLCARYGVKAYPSAYLIGADGRVVWEGHPMGREEPVIQQALRSVSLALRP